VPKNVKQTHCRSHGKSAKLMTSILRHVAEAFFPARQGTILNTHQVIGIATNTSMVRNCALMTYIMMTADVGIYPQDYIPTGPSGNLVLLSDSIKYIFKQIKSCALGYWGGGCSIETSCKPQNTNKVYKSVNTKVYFFLFVYLGLLC